MHVILKRERSCASPERADRTMTSANKTGGQIQKKPDSRSKKKREKPRYFRRKVGEVGLKLPSMVVAHPEKGK